MQALSKAEVGENYTIQWLFGLPEVVEFLHRHHVARKAAAAPLPRPRRGRYRSRYRCKAGRAFRSSAPPPPRRWLSECLWKI